MRKLLIASAFLALALPVAASAETITTGVSNSVGSSVFCGMLTANSMGVYNAGGTTTTDSWANKNVTSGYDNAGVGSFSPSSSTSKVVTTSNPGSGEVPERKDVSAHKGADGKNVSDAPGQERRDAVEPSTTVTTTTTSNPGKGNGASVGLNGITENSGSASHTVLSFSQYNSTDSNQTGHLTQFSANSSVSSFVSTGM